MIEPNMEVFEKLGVTNISEAISRAISKKLF